MKDVVHYSVFVDHDLLRQRHVVFLDVVVLTHVGQEPEKGEEVVVH